MFNDIKKFADVVKRIIGILDKNDRRKSCVVMADILFCAILETVGVSLIVPFMNAISSPEKLQEYPLIGRVVEYMGIDDVQLILFMSISIVVFYILKNLFLMYSSYFQNSYRFRLQKKLSVKMLKAYMSKPYQFFVETNSSVIIRGIGNDVGCVKDALGTMFDLVTQVLTLIMVATYLAYTDLFMAMGLLSVSLMCMYVLVVVLRKRTSSLGREQRLAETRVTKYSYELLEGIKEIMAMRRKERFIDAYEGAFDEKGKIETRYVTVLTFPNRIIETVFMSGIIIILYLRVIQGTDLKTFLPQLAVFALGGIKMLPAMSTISRSVTQIIFQKPGVDEAYANISSVKSDATLISEKNISNSATDITFENISLNDIHWRYTGSDKDVIDGVSLKISRGESIAFIGASGSGKTTLVDIILGLFTPQRGLVEVNGIDLKECIDSWSHVLAYVQQSIFLTDDTLRNNIAFGLKPEEIDDDKIWKAIEQAQLGDFVKALDNGLDTIVGERGVKFSGGQRQRVAIARALFFETQVIVFDEATAALDNETEKALMESIDALHGDKTLIIVAHRLSTVRNCDRVYEVNSGKIVERTKKELGL